MINKHEIECMINYYYGNSELNEIDYSSLKELVDNDNLKRIYGIFDNNEKDAWYLICSKHGKSRIVPKRYGNFLGCEIVEKFKDKCEFIHIRPTLIKRYARGIFPIIYKNEDISTKRKPVFDKYMSKHYYPLIYAKYGRNYITFSNYKGIKMMNKFSSEAEAILSLITTCDTTEEICFDNLFLYVVDNRKHELELNGELIL